MYIITAKYLGSTSPLKNIMCDMLVTLEDLLDNVHILACSTRSISDIAEELGTEEGAIVNPIICTVNGQPVLVMMAGDKACDPSQVSRVLNLHGPVIMMTHDQIVQLTGSGVEALYPVELAERIPTILDASLKRFNLLYSRAGCARCLIATSFSELSRLTDGVISYAVASPTWHPHMSTN